MRRSSSPRRLLIVALLACGLAACGREAPWTQLDVAELRDDALLRLTGEGIHAIASAPDGAVFVSTSSGSVYRRMPRGREWTRIGTAQSGSGGPARLSIHAFSARGFVATEFSRIYRWREGEPVREEKTALSDSTAGCGDFTADVWMNAVWGTEDDTYVAAGHGNVLHYRDGRWRLERTPLTDVQPDLCYESYESDLTAIGGADGWVYAAGRRIVRSRGDGRWQEVRGPGRGDTAAAIGGIASADGGMLFAASLWRGHYRAEPDSAAAHSGGPAAFFSSGGIWLLTVRGRRVHAWWPKDGRTRLRGAAPAGTDVLLAVNDSLDGLVVRLPR